MLGTRDNILDVVYAKYQYLFILANVLKIYCTLIGVCRVIVNLCFPWKCSRNSQGYTCIYVNIQIKFINI